jgi:hypothetical protein
MNSIAANGVLLVPEASSGCQCAYSLQCTVAYHAVSRNRAWGVYSAPADGSPAKRVALVFGAPGDRRDSSGNLWLGYPRPYAGRLVAAAGVQTPVATNAPAGAEAPEFVQGDPGFADIAGTADPWIYACGWSGVTNFSVQIHDDPAAWTLCDVRLHFAETEGRAAGGRVFDVALEGRQVLKGFDPAAEAGGPGRAVVREFRDVRVLGWLDVSLAPVRGRPLVSAVEIQRRWVIPSVADSEAVAAESRTGAIELPAAFADGAPMAVGAAIVAGPGHGKLKRVSGRKYDYAPDPRFAGTDRFSWKAVDGTNESRVVAVAVNVKPDVEPPSVTADVFGGAVGRDELTLRFSEPVDPVTAADPANYSISGGATVRGAALRRDGVTVRLATSALAEGQAYEVSVTGVKDTAATPNAAAGARAQVRYSVAGSILREVWLGVTGPGMNGLRSHPDYPDKPSLVEKVSCFEGPQNWADAYGTRLRGHVRPPVSGSYTFWIAADGDGELWLSADETPGKKTMIASTKGTAFRQWNRYPTQKSAAIELEAGRMYYVEALQKEGGSDDNLSVAWEGPGIQCEVIPGAHLLLP